jgi:hypothetical protein
MPVSFSNTKISFGPKNAMLVVLLRPVSTIRSTPKLGSLSVGPPAAARALVLWTTGAGGGGRAAALGLLAKVGVLGRIFVVLAALCESERECCFTAFALLNTLVLVVIAEKDDNIINKKRIPCNVSI